MAILCFLFDFDEKWAQNGRRPIKGDYMLLLNFVEKWVPYRPKADKRRFYVLYLIKLKNEPQIGWRPIKGDSMFWFNLVEKWVPNRPKADKWGFYVLNLISLKKSPKSAKGRWMGILCFLFEFVEKWATNRPKANKKRFLFKFKLRGGGYSTVSCILNRGSE
jgi:hypothetical protein